MGITLTPSPDGGLVIALTAPVIPADEFKAIDEIQHWCACSWEGQQQCDCKVGLHRFKASGDRMRYIGTTQLGEVFYCASGCGRVSCVASKAGYAAHCCPQCAVDGTHSDECNANWPGMESRIIKKA